MLEELKTNTIFQVLKNNGAQVSDSFHMDLIEEDFDGDELLEINSALIALEEELKDLGKVVVKNNHLFFDDLKYRYSNPSQFFIHYDKPDCLYLRLIDDFLKGRKINKKVFLIYDYDEDAFALSITTYELYQKIQNVLTELYECAYSESSEAQEYIIKAKPRVIEFTGIENNEVIRIDIIVHDDN